MNDPSNISNWIIKVEEISAGVYNAIATDKQGRKIELSGLDPNKLIEDCRKAATEINGQVHSD